MTYSKCWTHQRCFKWSDFASHPTRVCAVSYRVIDPFNRLLVMSASTRFHETWLVHYCNTYWPLYSRWPTRIGDQMFICAHCLLPWRSIIHWANHSLLASHLWRDKIVNTRPIGSLRSEHQLSYKNVWFYSFEVQLCISNHKRGTVAYLCIRLHRQLVLIFYLDRSKQKITTQRQIIQHLGH